MALLMTPKMHLENKFLLAKPNSFHVVGGQSRGGFSVFLNKTEVTIYIYG